MFNGIIENLGEVQELNEDKERLFFDAHNLSAKLSKGDSIAVNGVCLTVINTENSAISVDVMPETLKRSNLGLLKKGDLLNLELPITASSMINGHFVYGHVDTVASLKTVVPDDNSYSSKLNYYNNSENPLHVYSEYGEKCIIITVYKPSLDEWKEDYMTRRRNDLYNLLDGSI